MSVLEEPPHDRLPVTTYVCEHDANLLMRAIEKELRRGGQVYYLHNRTESMEVTAYALSQQLSGARIGIAHGRMSEEQLSEVWRKVLENEIDILVCTTIIETGVDVSNANTLIIEDADRMGLSQLHQLRGRVGRSSRRASAYFTFRRGRSLSEIASKRLEAIKDFTQFGAGFKIAMRDLEIRGAGNLLGSAQHGHMESVGYDMYIKLLSLAISEEKGETKSEPQKECIVDIQLDAHIPEKYIDSLPRRLAAYRRIADIKTYADAEDVRDELNDRYGAIPAQVEGLIAVALFRFAAPQYGIYEINYQSGFLNLFVEKLNFEAISKLSEKLPGRVTLKPKGKTCISVRSSKGIAMIETLGEIMVAFQAE
jgi:transcription-repair coupling factor (superfamily II helicase)